LNQVLKLSYFVSNIAIITSNMKIANTINSLFDSKQNERN